jgi:hypothetical protein
VREGGAAMVALAMASPPHFLLCLQPIHSFAAHSSSRRVRNFLDFLGFFSFPSLWLAVYPHLLCVAGNWFSREYLILSIYI